MRHWRRSWRKAWTALSAAGLEPLSGTHVALSRDHTWNISTCMAPESLALRQLAWVQGGLCLGPMVLLGVHDNLLISVKSRRKKWT